MLVHNKDKHMDLLEVFCEQTSQLTTSARGAGLKAERWTKEDFDLSRPAGCQAAMKRLRELRPKETLALPSMWTILSYAECQSKNPGTNKGLNKEKRTRLQNVAKLHPTGLAPSRARWLLLH